jgi:hypothetical protein
MTNPTETREIDQGDSGKAEADKIPPNLETLGVRPLEKMLILRINQQK